MWEKNTKKNIQTKGHRERCRQKKTQKKRKRLTKSKKREENEKE